MARIDDQAPALEPTSIAQAILEAPGWARVGITMADPRMRERAAQELALSIVETLDPQGKSDPRQLPLFS